MPIKQYVNLDPNVPDQLNGLDKKRAGKNITFTAKLNKPVEGLPIMFEMTAGSKNVASGLDAGNFTRRQLRQISKTAIGGMGLPGSVKRRILTDSKGESKIKLILSECGGDEFTVKAYIPSRKGNGTELASETFVVWRRLYYQVSRFKGGPKAPGRTGAFLEIEPYSWGPVADEFKTKNHNIELVSASTTDLITRHWNTEWNMKLLEVSAKEGYDNTKEPVTIRAVLVNELTDTKVKRIQFPIVKENVDVVKSLDEYLFFDESKEPKKDFLIGATWRYVGETLSEEKELDFKYIEAIDSSTLKIHFSKIPKRHLLDIWRKVTVELQIRVVAGSTNGLSYGNCIWMADANMHWGPRTNLAKQVTTIHEIGHYIGMVVVGQKDRYEGKGHQGPHCAHGLSDAEQKGDDFRGLKGTCIMFGESNGETLECFCENCSPSIRRERVPPNRMETDWN